MGGSSLDVGRRVRDRWQRRTATGAAIAMTLSAVLALPLVAQDRSPAAPSPTASSSPVEHLWSATGPEGMRFPWDMAIDPQGRLWVADTGNSRFAIFTPEGAFVEYWGTKGSGDGEFDLQRDGGDGYGAIEFAPDGSFYVLDVGNLRVQHFDSDRQLLGSWGGPGPGPGQYKDPIGLAVDAAGVVYVLDDQRALVEMYDADGTVLGSFDPHLAGRNSANASALDAQGNLVIDACCMAGNHIQRVDPSGALLQVIGAEGIGDGLFTDQPLGLAVDRSGLVFASQWGTGSNIQVFGPDGRYLAQWDGTNGGDFDVLFPAGITLDGLGNVYVSVANFEWKSTAGNSIEKFRLLPPFDPDSVALVSAPPSTPEPSPIPAIGQTADNGARITAVDVVDARTRDLTIDSPSVGVVKVRLLLPSRFDAEPTTAWPVLYLLHGAWGNHGDWTNLTDVAALTAPTDLLVVMPDGGAAGWYTDYWNHGSGGRPAWETFHLTELRQLLERNWHAGDERVIAGLSMGGLGAMDYAARNPGMFLAVASYSGVLETIATDFDLQNDALWGDKVAQADIWAAHEPLSLAPGLKGIPLFVSYGSGGQGPLDTQPPGPDDGEAWLAQRNEAFVARLTELDIPVTVDAYGPGTHSWPYWERALHRSLPMLLEALGESPVSVPSAAPPSAAP
jgi:diacylglycerol O-acyltransferase / trehalose O-mycolyltransferase